MKTFYAALFVLLSILSAPFASAATGPDLTQLTTNIDFSTVTTAVLAIAAALALVLVGIRGAKIVLSMIRGG